MKQKKITPQNIVKLDEKQVLSEVQQNFNHFMRKLIKTETQLVGLQQSKSLISLNKSPQCLRIFLCTLSQTAK